MIEKLEYTDLMTASEAGLLNALRRHPDGGAVAMALERVCLRLGEGRAKHPRFAENVFHGIGYLSEEHGEAVREATKQEPGWAGRMDSALLDLAVVALRLVLREYEHPEEDR